MGIKSVAKPRKNSKRTPEQKAYQIEQILVLMHDGSSLFKACSQVGIAISNFLYWCDEDAELADRYARAREACVEKMAQEVLEISDEEPAVDSFGKIDSGDVQNRKLRVDTRKWLLSKLAPKKYGEKVQTEITGADGGPIKVADATTMTDDQLAAIAKGIIKPK